MLRLGLYPPTGAKRQVFIIKRNIRVNAELMPIQDNKSRLDVGHHMGERVFLLNILGIVIINT